MKPSDDGLWDALHVTARRWTEADPHEALPGDLTRMEWLPLTVGMIGDGVAEAGEDPVQLYALACTALIGLEELLGADEATGVMAAALLLVREGFRP